jgi:flagellin
VSFSINTNIASMQAQDYLRKTTEFQGKTINRVTSGLRIVGSGDDAAGLAIANVYRSDQAVLTQGIRNANDGLATLQTIDSGINNIAKLLDRARTLAAQSGSGTFTGDRSVLSDEFKSVMGEIDRQAQAIGLTRGGDFAKEHFGVRGRRPRRRRQQGDHQRVGQREPDELDGGLEEPRAVELRGDRLR